MKFVRPLLFVSKTLSGYVPCVNGTSVSHPKTSSETAWCGADQRRSYWTYMIVRYHASEAAVDVAFIRRHDNGDAQTIGQQTVRE